VKGVKNIWNNKTPHDQPEAYLFIDR